MTQQEDESVLLIGYARVSTQDQKLEAQIAALTKAGVHPDHIHTDMASGVSRKRPGMALLMKDVRPGDTVVVWKLDRFGRSIMDLLTRLEKLDAMGVRFRSLTEAVDTGSAIGRLLLHVLGAVAQFERELIAERTRRGMQHRKENGAVFGRDWKLPPEKRKEVAQLVRVGVKTVEIAKRFGISRGSVRNYSKHIKQRRPRGRPVVK